MIEHFYANSIQEYNQEKEAKEKAREAQKIEEARQTDELSKKSADAIKITVISIVVGVIGLIILIALYYFGKDILKYFGIIKKKQEIQGQETIVKADMVIASDGHNHETKLNTPHEQVMQLKKTASFRV
jgi:hypothetical protein